MQDIKKVKIDAIVLAGGKTEESLRGHSDCKSKGFIKINNRPMVEYVLEAIRETGRFGKIVLAADLSMIPEHTAAMADMLASSGASIVESLKNGISALKPLPDFVLVLPCDMPLVTPEAITNFIDQSLELPADMTYAYLSKENSEASYPDVKHTYVRILEGTFCGTGFFLMKPEIAGNLESLFSRFINNRKSPIGLAGILGFNVIIKFLLGFLSVEDVEKRVTKLMGGKVRVKGVRTRYAEAGFNVDAPNELKIARQIMENRKNE